MDGLGDAAQDRLSAAGESGFEADEVWVGGSEEGRVVAGAAVTAVVVVVVVVVGVGVQDDDDGVEVALVSIVVSIVVSMVVGSWCTGWFGCPAAALASGLCPGGGWLCSFWGDGAVQVWCC